MEHSQESSDGDLYLFDDDYNVFLSAVAQQQCMVVQPAKRSADARLGDSTQGRLVNKDCNRVQGHERLMKDYIAENPTYNAIDLRRRFCMSRPLFLRIMDTVQQVDGYFAQKPDATGQMGFLVLQKCTSAMRQLAYGSCQIGWMRTFAWWRVLVANACVACSSNCASFWRAFSAPAECARRATSISGY
uniref:Uncharacterized protein n=1 Tax=Hyaloperonospora arabidopsidis (strain Emoy2) TaxID=559515 RepID=M4BKA7_HYAAE